MSFIPEKLQPIIDSPFFVGIVGGIVALRGVPGSTWPERAFNVMSASAMAGFSGPAISEWFGLTSPAMSAGVAFMVGLFGLNIVATAVEWIRNAKPSDVFPWWPRKGG